MIDYSNLNKYQTKLTDDLLSSLPKNVRNELIEFIDGIEFIKWLIQPESIRGLAKDRPKMTDGRIIVDITRPHILEDMDFFRERAIHFNKYDKYTNIPPNPNPKSEYGMFWKEELRRWKYGLVRESDGEWIPGYYYFYLNYCSIWLNIESEDINTVKSINNNRNKVKGDRVRGFPEVWLGDYLWFHYFDQARQNGSHTKLLKRRGCGFSLKWGAMTPCTMYTQPGLPCFHLASDKTFLEGDKGVFGKVVGTLDWIGKNTPLSKLRITDKPLEKKIGYKDEYGIERGLLSSVFGLSLKDDPDKARGVRGPLVQYEEDGVFPNLEDAWSVNRKAVEDGDITFGVMCAGGTGGTANADFQGSERLFYYPGAYNIYGIPNVFDKNVDSSNLCGFFWGAYLNRARCYDKSTGEPDVIKALIEVLSERDVVKRTSNDIKALTQLKAEDPITPQEAVMVKFGTVFPTSEIRECLAEILPNEKKFTSSHWVGDLVLKQDMSVDFVTTDDVPIRDFPLSTTSNKHGALEIFEMPIRLSDGKTTPYRYIGAADPIDDDASTTNSLPSIFIFDRFTDRIVAEYTGRPKFADEFYEKCRRLLIFYGATLNYENDKKGLYAHFKNTNCLHLLCDNLEILDEKGIAFQRQNYGNKKKGTNSSEEVNAWGRRLQAEWMLKEAYGSSEEDKCINLYKIRSIAYLKEAMSWNQDGNFDRVSAMGMLMLYREDLRRISIKSTKEKVKTRASDPYWDKFSLNK